MSRNHPPNQPNPQPTTPPSQPNTPIGANLGAVEWTTVLATGITILASIASIAYLYGVFNTRIGALEILVKEANDNTQGIKTSMVTVQHLSEEVGRIKDELQNIRQVQMNAHVNRR